MKDKQGTWIRLNPDTRALMDSMLGLIQKSRTQYVSELVEEDVANKLGAVEGIDTVLDSQVPGLSQGLGRLRQRVAIRQSGGSATEIKAALESLSGLEETTDESRETAGYTTQDIDLP